MDNVSQEREILRNNKKEMIEIKNMVTDEWLHGVSNRVDMAEKTISELEDTMINSFNTESQREKEKMDKIFKKCRVTTKGIIYI